MTNEQQIQLDTIVAQTEAVITADIDGEVVMMQMEESAYYGLDPIASIIWEQLAKPQMVTDLCSTLLEKYAVDRETCEEDVLAHLNEMYADKLVKIVA